MGAKQSAEMTEALRLIAAGKSPAEAARATGLTKGAISTALKKRREKKNAQKTDSLA